MGRGVAAPTAQTPQTIWRCVPRLELVDFGKAQWVPALSAKFPRGVPERAPLFFCFFAGPISVIPEPDPRGQGYINSQRAFCRALCAAPCCTVLCCIVLHRVVLCRAVL